MLVRHLSSLQPDITRLSEFQRCRKAQSKTVSFYCLLYKYTAYGATIRLISHTRTPLYVRLTVKLFIELLLYSVVHSKSFRIYLIQRQKLTNNPEWHTKLPIPLYEKLSEYNTPLRIRNNNFAWEIRNHLYFTSIYYVVVSSRGPQQ